MKRLSLNMKYKLGDIYLPNKFILLISVASSLERLTLVIPELRDFKALAETIRSLQKLKVADLTYLDIDEAAYTEQDEIHAAESLVTALCCCPLLQALTLEGVYLRDPPAELAAASQMTSLVFRDPDVALLNIAHDTLPRSLQRLLVTTHCRDGGDTWFTCGDLEATAPCPPRDFAGLLCVQQLQLTVHGMGLHLMPTGLRTLHLEADVDSHVTSDDAASFLQCISALACQEKLHLTAFFELGKRPQDMAAALLNLRRLRALALTWCDLAVSPATAILSQLTLLSLRNNCLSTLTDALPADSVQNLRVLDISGNPPGRPPEPEITYWRDANIMAIGGSSWSQLQVLGIRPPMSTGVTGRLRATADTLRIKLQRQAAAAQPPRPPPVVVFSELHEELLRPSDELAEVA